MTTKNGIWLAFKTLKDEQKLLAEWHMGLKFICSLRQMDTIPIMLIPEDSAEPFSVWSNGIRSPYFRLEKVDEETGCAKLSLLEALNMDGCPVDVMEEVYTLRKTDRCILLETSCFCAIHPLSPELLNKPLPNIEPK